MNSYKLSDLLQLLGIAHHIPGRIRLKVLSVEQAQARGLGLDDVERFLSALRQIEGIQSVKLNTVSLSCVIDYNTEVVSHDTWSAMLSVDVEHSAAAAMLRQLDSGLTTVETQSLL